MVNAESNAISSKSNKRRLGVGDERSANACCTSAFSRAPSPLMMVEEQESHSFRTPLIESIIVEDNNKRPRLMICDSNDSSDTDSSPSSAPSCSLLLLRSDLEENANRILHRNRSSLMSISSTLTEVSNSDQPATRLSESSLMILETEESLFDVVPHNSRDFAVQHSGPERLDSLTNFVEDCSLNNNKRARRRGNIYSTPSSVPPEYFERYVSNTMHDPNA